jgi:peroxiredoxin
VRPWLRAGLVFMTIVASAFGATAIIGEGAPQFALTDTNGKALALSDFKGKYVVLEWFNHQCPFVGKHYKSRNMQQLQKTYTGQGVIWLSINSTHPKHQEYRNAEQSNALMKIAGASPTAVLLDSEGKVGALYGAKTTPHMFVVNPDGVLIYAGAIDDKRSTDVEDIKGAKNFVSAALNEAISGNKVTVANTASYGCSVKYK